MNPPQSKEAALRDLRETRAELELAQVNPELLLVRRDRSVVSAREAGASLRVIAEAAGISKDAVSRIVRQAEK